MADDKTAEQYDFAAPEAETPSVETPEAPPVEAGPPRGPDGKFLPVPKVHTHSPRLTKAAQLLGFSAEEIGATDSDQLYRDVQLASIEQERSRRERSVADATQPTPPPPEPVSEGVLDWGEEEDGTKLREDQYPKGSLVARMNKMLHEQGKIIKQLQSQLGQVHGYVEGQARQTLTQKIDAKFAERPEIFGLGTASTVKEGTPERTRRENLIAILRNDNHGTFEEKYERAFSTLYGFVTPSQPQAEAPTQAATPPPQTQRITPEQWNAGALAPATQRNGAKEPKGVALAKKTFLQLEAERRGSNGDGEDSDEF